MNTDQGGIVDFSSKTTYVGGSTEDLLHPSTSSQAATAAEKVREKKLRDDPMAIVLGPLHVDCRRCGARIKLSTKSPYDPLHWRMHRTRCLKRLKAIERKGFSSRMLDDEPLQGTSSVVPPIANPLSPLTSEDEHEPHSSLTSARSSMQPTVAPPVIRHSDPICEDYIRRYHGKEVEEPLSSVEHWKDWSWTRLSLPAFATTLPEDI
ncbi:hypothetical protein BDQ17DRAFT_1352742 [Cyathus striatus]|nr:hypothetical protein BDQ17DRAFT_1352742 [Cyathus striatus]